MLDLIELKTRSGTTITLRAQDVRAIESNGDGCFVQWVVGDILAKIECTTPEREAVRLWRGGLA